MEIDINYNSPPIQKRCECVSFVRHFMLHLYHLIFATDVLEFYYFFIVCITLFIIYDTVIMLIHLPK